MNTELINVLKELKEWGSRNLEHYNAEALDNELDRLIKLYGGEE